MFWIIVSIVFSGLWLYGNLKLMPYISDWTFDLDEWAFWTVIITHSVIMALGTVLPPMISILVAAL